MLPAAREALGTVRSAKEQTGSEQSGILAATNIAVIVALLFLLPITFVDGFKPVLLGILFWIVATSIISSVAIWRGYYALGTYIFLVGVSLGLFVSMVLPTEITPSVENGRYLMGAYFFALPILAAGGLLIPSASFVVALAGALLTIIAAFVRTGGALLSLPAQVASLAPPVLLMFLVAAMSWLYGNNLLLSLARVRQRTAEVERMTDELQESNQGLATAMQSVRQLASQMAATAERLAQAGTQITSTSQQQASGSAQQAAAVAQISATVEELSRTAAQIAESAAETLRSAEVGRTAVADTTSGMEAIKSRVESTTERIRLLGEAGQRIGEITDIINEIAGKTHLLAINAAIESAAAGEYGRRFAVVAQQVKELADETKTATAQVKRLIAQTQTATNASVIATEQMTKEVEYGLEVARRARQSIEEIVQRAQAISLATHQQQSASEQTVTAMRDIADISRQSASAAQHLADNARDLSDVSHTLRQAVAQLTDGQA